MTLARTFKHSANSWAPPALKPFHNHASMKRWMPSTERRKQHRHADNHSHRRSWQRCRTSIHATRRSGLLVQCRRKPRLWRQEKTKLVRRIPRGKAGEGPATEFAKGRQGCYLGRVENAK